MLRCFQPEDPPGDVPPITAKRPELVDADGGEALVCFDCGHRITSTAARIEVGGRHEHACENPHGYKYRVGCFAAAPGVVPVGEPSTFWTWFPGYSWQIVHCGGCDALAGWRYASAAGGFHGLILDQLRLVTST